MVVYVIRRRWLEEVGSPPKTLRGDPNAPDYLPRPLCRAGAPTWRRDLATGELNVSGPKHFPGAGKSSHACEDCGLHPGRGKLAIAGWRPPSRDGNDEPRAVWTRRAPSRPLCPDVRFGPDFVRFTPSSGRGRHPRRTSQVDYKQTSSRPKSKSALPPASDVPGEAGNVSS